ncbi:alpha/beta fold hydrolase [Streptomyces sp. NRRL WC-3742]|uniref:alpha/beta fold hydrolase n=1 Tax=Streptomyces sp. NRRL WC-3742 TaxID=1463934 RepID=UPI0004C57742|nr:alpha/beta hydrolase [Streptomyces sp. NRRL WC-3742]
MPHFTSHDGTTLHYTVAGSGPVLVCLAGGPGADVRDLAELGWLADSRTLVTLDARAAGRSETPADRATCAFPEQSRDLEALRLHLGAERLDLLGHSAGSLTVQAYAADHPQRVGRLVLITPAGLVAREIDQAEVEAIRARRDQEPGAAEALAAGAEPWLYGRWTEAARRHFEADAAYPQPPSWLREAFYVRPDPVRESARRAALPHPVLVIAGAEDGVAGTGTARRVASAYPAARLEVLPGCGHWPWIDEPAAVRKLLTGFLDG